VREGNKLKIEKTQGDVTLPIESPAITNLPKYYQRKLDKEKKKQQRYTEKPYIYQNAGKSILRRDSDTSRYVQVVITIVISITHLSIRVECKMIVKNLSNY